MNLESTRSGPHPALAPHGAVKPASRTEAGEGSRRFDDAMQLLESGCWQASFLSLAELADEGHAQAARIALVFAKRGTSLFGGTFRATELQRSRWEQALG